MNHKITLHLPQTTAPVEPGLAPAKRLLMLVLALGTLAGTGCFRATGQQRSPMVAEVLPETGGDKVNGLKTKGGAGNLYLGNDFIQVAIDNTPYLDAVRTPIAGAPSGGGIIDASYVQLDASYARVSPPGNSMNRLTQVVNQDPNQPMVFDTFVPSNTSGLSSITMTGGILNSSGVRMAGVSVTYTISVAQLDRFFTLSTTVTNQSGASVPVRNIGDFLAQQNQDPTSSVAYSGYSFNIPAIFDYQGKALTTPWGVEIPGTNFADPLGPLVNSVQAPMVGLMGTEPGADTLDSHCSIGILPVDAEQLLVAADPQHLLDVPTHLKPNFPARLVAGSLPATSDLADGASLTYNRRLFIIGGTSISINVVGGLSIAANYPNQATGLFNLLDTYRYNDASIRPVQEYGTLTFTLSGMSQRQGPVPTEIRIERNVNAVTLPAVAAPESWQLQRVEWFEPNENLASPTVLAPSTLSVRLPVGIYRMVLTSRDQGVTYTQTRTLFQNLNQVASPNGQNQFGTEGPIWIQKDQEFLVSPQDILSPIAAVDVIGGVPDVPPVPYTPTPGNPNAVGAITGSPYTLQYFTTTEANAPVGSLQPLRIVFKSTGTLGDPVMRRMRTLATYFDAVDKGPAIASVGIPGQYQFRAGNEMFGTAFSRLAPALFAWLPNNQGGTATYRAYGTRGPLAALQFKDLTVADSQTDNSYIFTISPEGLPPGWTSFDVPGPGQATTGGYLPGEKLASAMANGIQVVGHTERDIQVDAPTLYNNFRSEFGAGSLSSFLLPASLSNMSRPTSEPFGHDPYVVGGRTSTLAGYGEATALFTPVATNAPLGGVLTNQNWTLADFLAQGQGQFNVVLRPRAPATTPQTAPAGLFSLQGAPQPADPGNWWNQPGPLSNGKPNGGFDALELLCGESLAGSTPSAWFSEFLQVRADWFGILNQQVPSSFTKALGLSSAKFSLDTPVGLARTYLKANVTTEDDLSGVLAALQSGAAVASTGPFLDVSVGSAGPGGLVPGPVQNVTLVVKLWKSDWVPVDELRVIVNGVPVTNPVIDIKTLVASGTDTRMTTASFNLPLAQLTGGKNAWIVVEAGVPLAGPTISVANQSLWDTWNAIMRGIYPIAVTNPIFVDVVGDGYQTPTL